MDFGIFYEIQVNSPLKHREREAEVFHQVLDQVVAAEEAGFNNFWSVEHHFQPGFSHSSAPEVLYGALSQRTSRIRIGHAVVLPPFPYNHPVRVAERIATLDILSKGRVEVGTGRSGTIQELGGFGIPPEETRPRWEEALRLLVNIWTSKEGTFSWKGKYFDIPERSIVPLPVQKPHPPLWLACSNEETHKIAGRMGLGLLTLVVMVGPEEVARRINLYRDALKEVKPVGAFVNNRTAVFYMVHCADTDKEARGEREARLHVLRQHNLHGERATASRGEGGDPRRPGARRGQPTSGGFCTGGQHGLPAAQSHGHLRQPRHLHRAARAYSESHRAGSHHGHAAVLVDTARKGDEIDPVVWKTCHPAFRQTKRRSSRRSIPLIDSLEQRP
jgi:alkanesulfonate monooxygenase SsuD/methylene tetrahydromethanopterin reductase-like flavin-dependent oxidoreductase (luciferase family)